MSLKNPISKICFREECRERYSTRHPEQKFCSIACGNSARQAEFLTLKCAFCERDFASTTLDKNCCSSRCKNAYVAEALRRDRLKNHKKWRSSLATPIIRTREFSSLTDQEKQEICKDVRVLWKNKRLVAQEFGIDSHILNKVLRESAKTSA